MKCYETLRCQIGPFGTQETENENMKVVPKNSYNTGRDQRPRDESTPEMFWKNRSWHQKQLESSLISYQI